eukprot:CAMPEP_0113823502 /NCGR_PEP_ID=MMETSP0328-20130328/2774_1 /TAXON_ID=39455 /ORGANISM="Alexandrium minutum" /LENGTH=144 /DNA_ID=CAMNT_0000791441 /DNA_START=9 /DNA_END=439 /DNA_ORIENTATION=+ /assembly_acc=CAM_ASM_000350
MSSGISFLPQLRQPSHCPPLYGNLDLLGGRVLLHDLGVDTLPHDLELELATRLAAALPLRRRRRGLQELLHRGRVVVALQLPTLHHEVDALVIVASFACNELLEVSQGQPRVNLRQPAQRFASHGVAHGDATTLASTAGHWSAG